MRAEARAECWALSSLSEGSQRLVGRLSCDSGHVWILGKLGIWIGMLGMLGFKGCCDSWDVRIMNWLNSDDVEFLVMLKFFAWLDSDDVGILEMFGFR